VVYGCDAAWWVHRKGLPEFDGLKACYRDNGLAGFPDVRRIEINKREDKLQTGQTGLTGNGGNSGFQALNLAIQFGARQILLIGFDMSLAGGVHWYGPNKWQNANNPNDSNFKRWIEAFEGSAALLKQMGVEVVNCSQTSAIRCFPQRSIEDALSAWL
jgi:hypothetical protein